MWQRRGLRQAAQLLDILGPVAVVSTPRERYPHQGWNSQQWCHVAIVNDRRAIEPELLQFWKIGERTQGIDAPIFNQGAPPKFPQMCDRADVLDFAAHRHGHVSKRGAGL